MPDMVCETISPVRPDKCPPVIEDSDKTLTKICYDRAHEIYGPQLPEVVEKRLERELKCSGSPHSGQALSGISIPAVPA